MSNFPITLDDTASLPNPGTTDKTNSPSHAGLHGNTNAAIKAIETKLGTGDTEPSTDSLLIGTGAGQSAWGTVTSAQLLAAVSDETGTGSLVFNTAPTLNLPKVDTINENTSANGVTIDGLNIKDGVITTANAVTTDTLAESAVTNSKLSTDAGEIGGAWEDWTPTLTGFSTDPTSSIYRYKKIGKIVAIQIRQTGNGTSNSSSFKISLPVPASTNNASFESVIQPVNGGALDTSNVGIAVIDSADTANVVLYRNLSGSNWTASGGKRIGGVSMIYEAA